MVFSIAFVRFMAGWLWNPPGFRRRASSQKVWHHAGQYLTRSSTSDDGPTSKWSLMLVTLCGMRSGRGTGHGRTCSLFLLDSSRFTQSRFHWALSTPEFLLTLSRINFKAFLSKVFMVIIEIHYWDQWNLYFFHRLLCRIFLPQGLCADCGPFPIPSLLTYVT